MNFIALSPRGIKPSTSMHEMVEAYKKEAVAKAASPIMERKVFINRFNYSL